MAAGGGVKANILFFTKGKPRTLLVYLYNNKFLNSTQVLNKWSTFLRLAKFASLPGATHQGEGVVGRKALFPDWFFSQ